MSKVIDRVFFGPHPDKSKIKCFEELLDSKHAGEVARFLSKISNLRRNYNKAEADAIYARFIEDNSDNSASPFGQSETDTLNLSATLRQIVKEKLASGMFGAAAFDEVVAECERLCVTNGFVAEFESLENAAQKRAAQRFGVGIAVALIVLVGVGVVSVLANK